MTQITYSTKRGFQSDSDGKSYRIETADGVVHLAYWIGNIGDAEVMKTSCCEQEMKDGVEYDGLQHHRRSVTCESAPVVTKPADKPASKPIAKATDTRGGEFVTRAEFEKAIGDLQAIIDSMAAMMGKTTAVSARKATFDLDGLDIDTDDLDMDVVQTRANELINWTLLELRQHAVKLGLADPKGMGKPHVTAAILAVEFAPESIEGPIPAKPVKVLNAKPVTAPVKAKSVTRAQEIKTNATRAAKRRSGRKATTK